jgi:hypothetical protein
MKQPFTDRALAQRHLVQAERHIAQGAEAITRQESLIAQLDRDGHKTREARKVLATMRETQALHVESRDRILRELEE